MSDFNYFEVSVYEPRTCFTCQTHVGPYVLLLHDDERGAYHICQGCLVVAARLVGCSDPGIEDSLHQLVEQQREQIQQLEAQLSETRGLQNRVISMDEIPQFVDEMMQRLPKTSSRARGNVKTGS